MMISKLNLLKGRSSQLLLPNPKCRSCFLTPSLSQVGVRSTRISLPLRGGPASTRQCRSPYVIM